MGCTTDATKMYCLKMASKRIGQRIVARFLVVVILLRTSAPTAAVLAEINLYKQGKPVEGR